MSAVKGAPAYLAYHLAWPAENRSGGVSREDNGRLMAKKRKRRRHRKSWRRNGAKAAPKSRANRRRCLDHQAGEMKKQRLAKGAPRVNGKHSAHGGRRVRRRRQQQHRQASDRASYSSTQKAKKRQKDISNLSRISGRGVVGFVGHPPLKC